MYGTVKEAPVVSNTHQGMHGCSLGLGASVEGMIHGYENYGTRKKQQIMKIPELPIIYTKKDTIKHINFFKYMDCFSVHLIDGLRLLY